MSWLYGQTWLWYLIAFLVGVLLAWLLLVRPQQRRLRALQDGPTRSTRPGGTDPDPGRVDIGKEWEHSEQTRTDTRATTDKDASGDGSVATGAAAAGVGATALAATAASRHADDPKDPDDRGSADSVADGSAGAEPGTAAGEPVVLAREPVVVADTDHDRTGRDTDSTVTGAVDSGEADGSEVDTTDVDAAEVHMADAAQVDPAGVSTSAVADSDDVDTAGMPVVGRDGEASEPVTDRLPAAEPATEQLPVAEHTIEPATEQLPAAEPETKRFHAVDPALSTLDTTTARSSAGLDVAATPGRVEPDSGLGATAAGAEGPGAVTLARSASDRNSTAGTGPPGATAVDAGTDGGTERGTARDETDRARPHNAPGAGVDESGTTRTDRGGLVGDADPASATSTGAGSDRPAPFGPGSTRPESDGSAPSPEFTIKGNANSMLFHPPESPYYVRTRAEVWFVTEEDAKAAGFRRWRPKT